MRAGLLLPWMLEGRWGLTGKDVRQARDLCLCSALRAKTSLPLIDRFNLQGNRAQKLILKQVGKLEL